MTIKEIKIETSEVKEGSRGKFANISFTEDGTKIFCKIWNDKLELMPLKYLKVGNIVSVDVNKDEKYGWVISKVALVKESPVGLPLEDRERMFNSMIELLSYDTGSATPIMLEIRDLLDVNRQAFITCPAARAHHHNYVGGLIRHTSEILAFINEHKTSLTDSEYMRCVLGAVLHDFGKCFEYSIDEESGVITYNTAFGESLGLHKHSKVTPHIYWGHNWCIEKGFKKLAHLVGAHHNNEEWGSMFKPNNKEAEMLFIADYFSSRFGLISVEDIKGA